MNTVKYANGNCRLFEDLQVRIFIVDYHFLVRNILEIINFYKTEPWSWWNMSLFTDITVKSTRSLLKYLVILQHTFLCECTHMASGCNVFILLDRNFTYSLEKMKFPIHFKGDIVYPATAFTNEI